MMIFVVVCWLVTGCGYTHLHPRTFSKGNISVECYQVSTLTNVFDRFDLHRFGWTQTILKASYKSIDSVLIQEDTVTIKVGRLTYINELTAKTLQTFIRWTAQRMNQGSRNRINLIFSKDFAAILVESSKSLICKKRSSICYCLLCCPTQ
jgi:hypothetical protein